MATAARRYIEIEVTADKALQSLRNIEKSSAQAEKRLQSMQQAVQGLRNSFLAARTGILAFAGSAGLGSLNDAATDLRTRLQGVVVGQGAVQKAFSDLQAIALKTGVAVESIGGSFTRLGTAIQGIEYDDLIQGLDTIATTLATTGASTQGANAVLLQLGQALSSGALQGDEFRSVYENAPQLLVAWQKALGATDKALRDMSANADFTTESFFELQDQISSLIVEMTGLEKPPVTLSRAFQNLRSRVVEAFFFMQLEGGSALSGMAEAINNFALNIRQYEGVLRSAISITYEYGRVVYTVLQQAGGIVSGFASAVTEAGESVYNFTTDSRSEIEDWGSFWEWMFGVYLPNALLAFSKALLIVSQLIGNFRDDLSDAARLLGTKGVGAFVRAGKTIEVFWQELFGSAEEARAAQERLTEATRIFNETLTDLTEEQEKNSDARFKALRTLVDEAAAQLEANQARLEEQLILRQTQQELKDLEAALRNTGEGARSAFARMKEGAQDALQELIKLREQLETGGAGGKSGFEQVSELFPALSRVQRFVDAGDVKQAGIELNKLQQLMGEIRTEELDMSDKFQFQYVLDQAIALGQEIEGLTEKEAGLRQARTQAALDFANELARRKYEDIPVNMIVSEESVKQASQQVARQMENELTVRKPIDEKVVDAESIKQSVYDSLNGALTDAGRDGLDINARLNMQRSTDTEITEEGRKQ